jgi:trigger factor
MSTKVEKIGDNTVQLEVVVPAEKFSAALVKSYKKNAGKFNIPGFRKGRAPQNIIEKYYGKEVFYQDAEYMLFDEAYPAAVEENNIFPVDYPQIDIVQSEEGKDFIFTAKVTVKPEVVLSEYKGIEVEKKEYPVTDENVDTQVESMRERNARIINKEGDTVENGDITVIDFEGFVDGEPFEGGKAENYELTIGSNAFIPGFEDQIVGAKLGEPIEVNVTFPEDYQAENLKGKAAVFKVTVSAIKVKELPELDDEFAKDVSEFDTLDELKADLRKKQEENNTEKAKKDFEDEAVKKVVDAAQVVIPDIMIEREIDYMVKDLDYRLKYQNLDVDKYVELLGINMETLRNDFKEIATTRVKTNLVLEAISKTENLEVSEEDIEKRAEEIAGHYGTQNIEKMKTTILSSQRDIIKEELVNNKVIDFIVENSKVK